MKPKIKRWLKERKELFVFALGALLVLWYLGPHQWSSSSTLKPKTAPQKETPVPFSYPSSETTAQEKTSQASEEETDRETDLKVAGAFVQRESAWVRRVIDGDTVELSDGRRVRLIGIDTPESNQPYFWEAKNRLKELVEGKEVYLEKDISETDRFGRLLRYLWLDQELINLKMVKEGYAHSYTYPPDIKYQTQILAAEREARAKRLGLWSPLLSSSANPNGQCLIKGNISASGEKIYHLPGGAFYDKTKIDPSKGERWFCTEEEAQKAGWRKSKK